MGLHQSLSHFTQKCVLFLRKYPGKGGKTYLLKKLQSDKA